MKFKTLLLVCVFPFFFRSIYMIARILTLLAIDSGGKNVHGKTREPNQVYSELRMALRCFRRCSTIKRVQSRSFFFSATSQAAIEERIRVSVIHSIDALAKYTQYISRAMKNNINNNPIEKLFSFQFDSSFATHKHINVHSLKRNS